MRGTSSDTAPEVGRPEVPPEKRLCLLESESNVEHFWKYSQSGCITECASGLIKKHFDCRPFFLRGIIYIYITLFKVILHILRTFKYLAPKGESRHFRKFHYPKGKTEVKWTPLCDMEYYDNISDLYGLLQ